MVLTRGGHNEPILKKLIALLSDKQTWYSTNFNLT
jgi:hypothetical protein